LDELASSGPDVAGSVTIVSWCTLGDAILVPSEFTARISKGCAVCLTSSKILLRISNSVASVRPTTITLLGRYSIVSAYELDNIVKSSVTIVISVVRDCG
jgi:hypothetical protein